MRCRDTICVVCRENWFSRALKEFRGISYSRGWFHILACAQSRALPALNFQSSANGLKILTTEDGDKPNHEPCAGNGR